MSVAPKRYRLLGADGAAFESRAPGRLGGNRRLKIYGRLDCASAIRALEKGYARRRVFFLDEAAAIASGYRPCGRCLRERYRSWKASRTGRGGEV
jgi:methylphosphotriester-DNA--protein-cysteine methyltransferase